MNALIKHYKVLATMVALNEFTETDLSIISGVEEESVAKELAQTRFVESIDKTQRTGCPGNQGAVYRIIPDQRSFILKELDLCFNEINMKGINRAAATPLSLLLTEDILSFRIPSTKEINQQKELLDLAYLNMETASAEMGLELSKDTTPTQSIRSIESVELRKRFRSVVSRYNEIEEGLKKIRQVELPTYTISIRSKLMKHTFDFHKTTFSYLRNTTAIIQDQATLTFDTVLNQVIWIPDEGRTTIQNWLNVCRNVRERYIDYIEESFSGIERRLFK